MIKTVKKRGSTITVNAEFVPRNPSERRLRFYCSDALDFAKQHFPDLKSLSASEDSVSLTISNYSEPHSAEWVFFVNKEEQDIEEVNKNEGLTTDTNDAIVVAEGKRARRKK